MDKNYKVFLIIGVVVILVPFLGFPEIFKSILLFISGIVLIIISLMYRSRHGLIEDESNDELEIDIDEEQKKFEEISDNESVEDVRD